MSLGLYQSSETGNVINFHTETTGVVVVAKSHDTYVGCERTGLISLNKLLSDGSPYWIDITEGEE